MERKKLNYRHRLDTLNTELKKAGKKETVEFKHAQAGKHVYGIIEPFGDQTRECGIFYTKSDLVEYVNKSIGV